MRTAAIVSLLATLLLIVAVDLRQASFLIALQELIPLRDRGSHFVLMAGLSICCNLGFAGARIGPWRLGILGVSAALVVGAAMEEYSQKWLGHRNFDLVDLRYSVQGVLIGALVAWPILLLRDDDEVPPDMGDAH